MAESVKTNASAVKRRNGVIDLLRFVFSMIIVLHHTRYLLGDDNCLFLGGSLAVEFFFIVSGYLCMNSAEKMNAKTSPSAQTAMPEVGTGLGTETVGFIKKKLSGIIPEFITAWIIGFFFVWAAKGLTVHEAVRMFGKDFFELTLVKMSGLFTGGFDGVIWYISAMLLCMAILYPLLRRFPNFMPRIGCPLVALFFLGYLCRNYDHPRNPTVWTGIVYKGLIRCMAELCLGVVVFLIVRRIRKYRLNRPSAVAVAIIEILMYAAVIIYMYREDPSDKDYFWIFILCVAITLTFSGLGAGSHILDGRVTSFLAKYSTALYLSHIYYAQNLLRILPQNMSRTALVTVYLICAGGTAFVVMGIAYFLRQKKRAIMSGLKKCFLA